MNIAQMAESAAAVDATNQQNANAANAKAYLSPANIQIQNVIAGKSLTIEPSESGVPEPPSGGTAPPTQIPGSPKLEGAGGDMGTRTVHAPEINKTTDGPKFFKVGEHAENKNHSLSDDNKKRSPISLS